MALELKPLINGRVYGWGDIVVNLGGTPVTGIRGINYAKAQEKTNVYGAGRNVIARGYGRRSATASIILEASTVLALESSAPKKDLTRIAPFPIVVMYQPDAGPMVTERIHNAEFTNIPKEWAEGDMTKDVTLELIVSHID